MSDLPNDMRSCAKPWEGTGHIAEKYLLQGAARIDALETAIRDLLAWRALRTTPDGVKLQWPDCITDAQIDAARAETERVWSTAQNLLTQ